MKIALIVPEFPSLSQTFVLSQITGLIDRGHDVEIFAESASTEAKIHQDVMGYNLLQRTCYHREISRNMPENKLNRILKGIGCIIKYLPMRPLAVLNSVNILKYGMAIQVIIKICGLDAFDAFNILVKQTSQPPPESPPTIS